MKTDNDDLATNTERIIELHLSFKNTQYRETPRNLERILGKNAEVGFRVFSNTRK